MSGGSSRTLLTVGFAARSLWRRRRQFALLLLTLVAAFWAAFDPDGAIHWIFPAPETVRTLVTVTAFGLAGGLLPALRAARIQPASYSPS